MSYKALYRTYRPTTFDEVAGQKHIIKTLKNALSEKKIAHAYLFCGPRGTGKTTMARIFAKALDCEEGFGVQCNKCPNCIAINEGKHPDVIEIDAASNRGIDDIRDLISKVKYAPIMGNYKVYIIDEVHMMTTEAFNALLKTLEEPPANVVFILATTEPFKLMTTILSRCQRYDFTKVSDGDIYNRLFDICEKENITVDEEALSILVSLADGGVRDALSMLDQTIAYCGNTITLEAIQELYGLSTTSEKLALLNYLDKGDVINITNRINSMINSGIDIKRLTAELLELLKEILIYQTTKDESLLKQLKLTDIEYTSISINKINKMIDILLDAISQYRLVSNMKSLFEISMLKIASLNNVETENVKVVEKIVYVNNNPQQNNIPVNNAVIQEPKPVVEQEVVKPQVVNQPVQQEQLVKPKPVVEANPIVEAQLNSGVSFTAVQPLCEENGTSINYSMEDVLNIMVQATKECKTRLNDNLVLLEKLLTHNRVGKYASLLKNAIPRIVSKVAIVFESNLNSVVKKMNYKENQLGLSKVIEAIFGESCVVICMNHQEYVDSVTKFNNLRQANKLPIASSVNIDTKLNAHAGNLMSETEKLADELINR